MINYNIKIENLQIQNLTVNNKSEKKIKKKSKKEEKTKIYEKKEKREKLEPIERATSQKLNNMKIADAYVVLEDINKAVRMNQCFTHLEYLETKVDTKLIFANSCHVRLCPACGWRRSLKIYRENRMVFDYLKKFGESSKFIFLTLTCRNMVDYKLQDEVSEIINAFHIMFKYKKIKDVILGYVRALEVTYNKERKDYHPHIHVLINVKNDYFGRGYIHQSEFAEMWQKALKSDYMPVIDIRKFKVKRVETAGKELAEICKYCVKSSDLIQENVFNTAKVVGAIDGALTNKRLLGYSGSFRKARQVLNITTKNIEDFDNKEDYLGQDIPEDARKIIYDWHFGKSQYVLYEGYREDEV